MENVSKGKPFPLFGVLLVIIGIGLLFDRLNIMHFSWNKVWQFALVLVGIWMVVSAFIYNQRGKIFGGTFLFLLGLLFIMQSYDFIYMRHDIFWPSLLLILGFSFLMLFVFEPKDWGVIIPAIIFIGFGLFVIFARLGYIFFWDVWDFIGVYWPLILVIIGISILFSKKH